MENNEAAAAVATAPGKKSYGRNKIVAGFELIEGSLKDGTAVLKQITGMSTMLHRARADVVAKEFRGTAVIVCVRQVLVGEYAKVSYKTIELAKASVTPPAAPPAV